MKSRRLALRHLYTLFCTLGLVVGPAFQHAQAQTPAAKPASTVNKSKGKTSMSHPQVELTITGYGVVKLELDAEKAPKSVENFLDYVKSGHYNGTVFHRVIPGFMIQGGGFEVGMNQKPTEPPIENEANNGLKNDKYTVAMARTNDPHSATAQFFINIANNDFLNHKAPSAQGWGYAVFGKVIAGQDVVDKIAGVKTGTRGFHGDVPKEDVVIEKATAL
jgi:peptidyl-prolyl cis-trans isomerase B (cyclophilin B)